MVTTASFGGLATLAVAAGLLLVSGVSGVTTGLLGGLMSDCAVVTVALLPMTDVSCGVDGFTGVVTCCWLAVGMSLTGVVATDLGLGDTGFVNDLVLLLASSTLLAAGEGGFGDIGFAGDPSLLLSTVASSAAGEDDLFSSNRFQFFSYSRTWW